MAYQGNQPINGRFTKIDDLSSSFNSVLTTFALTASGAPVYPGSANNTLISLNGVLQNPGVAFTTTGSSITFSSPPPTGASFFGIILGSVMNVGVPSDGSIDTTKLATLDYVNINTGASPTSAPGKVFWTDTDGTLGLGLKGSNVTLRQGQDKLVRVINSTGSTIVKGKAVYISGTSSGKLTIATASNAAEGTSSAYLGVTAENISASGEGFVTVGGTIRNIDTSGFAPGTALWLGTSGNFVSTKVAFAPFIGYVLTQHATTGSMFIVESVGNELDELHDVLITSKTANDTIYYDSVSGVWKNIQRGTGNDSTFTSWMTKDLGSVFVDAGTVGTGTVTFDYTAGSIRRLQVSGALTIAFSNFPPSGNMGVMQIELVNGGSATVTFPTINWIKKDGTFTTSISTYLTDAGRSGLQTSGTDFLVVFTRDAGTTLYGKIL